MVSKMKSMAKEKDTAIAKLHDLENEKKAMSKKMKELVEKMSNIAKENSALDSELNDVTNQKEAVEERMEAMLLIVSKADEAKERALSDLASEREKNNRDHINREPEPTNGNIEEENDLIGPLKSELVFLTDTVEKNRKKFDSMKDILPNVATLEELTSEELAKVVQSFRNILDTNDISNTRNPNLNVKQEPDF